jgi:hypothetical protein
MKIALFVFGSLVALIGLMAAIGWTLPIKHTAARTISLNTSPSQLWAIISDFKSSVLWRSELKAVEPIEVEPGSYGWKEISKDNDSITYATIEAVPEQKMIRKIVDKNLPFGGSWTFQLAGQNNQTQLTITENGEVYNPIFRFMSRFVFGHFASLDKYIQNLENHLRANH